MLASKTEFYLNLCDHDAQTRSIRHHWLAVIKVTDELRMFVAAMRIGTADILVGVPPVYGPEARHSEMWLRILRMEGYACHDYHTHERFDVFLHTQRFPCSYLLREPSRYGVLPTARRTIECNGTSKPSTKLTACAVFDDMVYIETAHLEPLTYAEVVVGIDGRLFIVNGDTTVQRYSVGELELARRWMEQHNLV